MSAMPHPVQKTVEYASNVVSMPHAPQHITAKGHTDYLDFMHEKVNAKNERIDYLQEQITFLKTDLASAIVAAVGLAITLAITLYQWLVVCNGQAPVG